MGCQQCLPFMLSSWKVNIAENLIGIWVVDTFGLSLQNFFFYFLALCAPPGSEGLYNSAALFSAEKFC